MVVHHALVYTMKGQVCSNSPKGVHRDNMCYMVSEFIVDRKDISQGKGIVYGYNKKTPLIATGLRPSQGIFQLDLEDIELWYEITPTEAIGHNMEGYPLSISTL